jgi:adenylyltransferase/sulfurtransferase
MANFKIPTPLRVYTEGQSEVEVTGTTVAEAMDDLTRRFPALRQHIFTEDGKLRSFVNLFLNNEDIRQLEGASTPLKAGDRLVLIPSIAGG